jgi:hypothetical protein
MMEFHVSGSLTQQVCQPGRETQSGQEQSKEAKGSVMHDDLGLREAFAEGSR